jgi:hypothetical protein
VRAALAENASAPDRTAVELARLARLHPVVVKAGVRPDHTTAETSMLVEVRLREDPSTLASSLAAVLLLADAVKFGAAMPPPEEVEAGAQALLEALQHD